MERPDKRACDQLRPISFIPNVAPHATGSCLVSFGNTSVICAATIEDGVPGWMKYQKVEGGWLTAEYSMLPYSTLSRKPRDINRGKLDGRSSEIQRLIGRSLRAVVDLKALGPRTLWIDCDVLCCRWHCYKCAHRQGQVHKLTHEKEGRGGKCRHLQRHSLS